MNGYRENGNPVALKHGMSRSDEYKIWQFMRASFTPRGINSKISQS